MTFNVDRCTEIEKANRILLEKMTDILTGPGQNFPQNKKGLPPVHKSAKPGSLSHLRSLNYSKREREVQRITAENEFMLKRLQQTSPTYNVYDWNVKRKEQVKHIK